MQWACDTHHVTLTITDQARELAGPWGDLGGCVLTQAVSERTLVALDHGDHTRHVRGLNGTFGAERVRLVGGETHE